jgi:hypothetical protein
MVLSACAPVKFSSDLASSSDQVQNVDITDVSFFENNAGGSVATGVNQDVYIESTIGTVVTGQTVAVQSDQTKLNLGFLATLLAE